MGTRYQSLPRSINFSSTTLLSVPRLNSTGGEINFNTSSFDDARIVREYYYYQLAFPEISEATSISSSPLAWFSSAFPLQPRTKERKLQMRWSCRWEHFFYGGGKLRLKGWVLTFPWWRGECNLVASDKSFAWFGQRNYRYTAHNCAAKRGEKGDLIVKFETLQFSGGDTWV